MAEASFEKYIYGRKRMDALEEFDPRPTKHRNKVSEQLSQYLESVDHCGLGILLLLDPKTQYWKESTLMENLILRLCLLSRQDYQVKHN